MILAVEWRISPGQAYSIDGRTFAPIFSFARRREKFSFFSKEKTRMRRYSSLL
jgi:hypothetical protein